MHHFCKVFEAGSNPVAGLKMKFKEVNYLYHKFKVGDKIIRIYSNTEARYGIIRIIEFDTNWSSNIFVDYDNDISLWCDPNNLQKIQ